MACRTAMRCVLFSEPRLPQQLFRRRNTAASPPPPSLVKFPVAPLRCISNGDAAPRDEQGPPQEAVLKAISEVSKTEGRVAQTTNVVIGGTVSDDATDEWLVLDQKVNSYPMTRGFTAIGVGGDDFVQAMVVAVESVLKEPIPKGRVSQKVSSRGKYVSVKIGPVLVVSSEQVQAVYNAMRRDDRMKYFL